MRRIAQRLIRAEKKKRQILAHMDIDYDYPGYFSSSFSVNNSLQTFNSQEITRKNNVHRDNNNLGIVKTKAATKSTSTGDSSLKRANTELNHVEDKSTSKERSEINKSSMRQFVPKNVKEINYVLSSGKKSLKKQKYLTAITDNISEKFYSSMSKHIPSIGKKKKKMAYAQGELDCRNDLPKNEKSPLPTPEIKISAVADSSPVKLRSNKRDQRVNSGSKKQRTNPKSEKYSLNTDKSWNEDILLPSSRADSGSNIDVYITDDSNCKLRSSTSNLRMTVVGKKGQTVKDTAISKQIVTDNSLNKFEDISSCPRKVGRYKQYEIETSTMVDNRPLKLRSSKSNKITGVNIIKATDEETASKQKKISSQSDESSTKTIQSFQRKDPKTKLKVSTVS